MDNLCPSHSDPERMHGKEQLETEVDFLCRGGHVGVKREGIDSNDVNLGFPLKCD